MPLEGRQDVKSMKGGAAKKAARKSNARLRRSAGMSVTRRPKSSSTDNKAKPNTSGRGPTQSKVGMSKRPGRGGPMGAMQGAMGSMGQGGLAGRMKQGPMQMQTQPNLSQVMPAPSPPQPPMPPQAEAMPLPGMDQGGGPSPWNPFQNPTQALGNINDAAGGRLGGMPGFNGSMNPLMNPSQALGALGQLGGKGGGGYNPVPQTPQGMAQPNMAGGPGAGMPMRPY